MLIPSSLIEPPSLHAALGGSRHPVLNLSLPLLAGPAMETAIPGAVWTGRSGHFTLFESREWLLGHASAPAGEALEQNTRELYGELLRISRGLNLGRIWNYIPGINDARLDGLENYRAFCQGRAAAYSAAWGQTYKSRVPAASAVGSDGAHACIVFAAARNRAWNVENPFQVPAYEYPSEYGPVSPSFARATVVEAEGGRRDVFISGTAAIRGHATRAAGDTLEQLACTLDNLREISRAAGAGGDLGGPDVAGRSLKIYLRRGEDLDAVSRIVDAELVRPGDIVSYVRADICRRELNVEIEATILGSGTG